MKSDQLKLPQLIAHPSKVFLSLTPIIQPTKSIFSVEQLVQPLNLSSSNFFKPYQMVSNSHRVLHQITMGGSQQQHQQLLQDESRINNTENSSNDMQRSWIIDKLDAKKEAILNSYRRENAPLKNEGKLREDKEEMISKDSPASLRRRRILVQDKMNLPFMNLSVQTSTNKNRENNNMNSHNNSMQILQQQQQCSIQSMSESIETADDDSPESEFQSSNSGTKIRSNKRSFAMILPFSPTKNVPLMQSNSKETPKSGNQSSYFSNSKTSHSQSSPILVGDIKTKSNSITEFLLKPQRDPVLLLTEPTYQQTAVTKPQLFQSWRGRKQAANATSILSLPSDQSINLKSSEQEINSVLKLSSTESSNSKLSLNSQDSFPHILPSTSSKGILKTSNKYIQSSSDLAKAKPKSVSFLNKVITY